MSRLDRRIEDMLASGAINVDDADEVRTFAAFLRDAGPPNPHPDFDQGRVNAALAEHYPEVLVAELEELRTLRNELVRYTNGLEEHVATLVDNDPEHESRLILRDLQARLGIEAAASVAVDVHHEGAYTATEPRGGEHADC